MLSFAVNRDVEVVVAAGVVLGTVANCVCNGPSLVWDKLGV
ncbi:hypothetical protein [Acinetobacter baumannii]|nr:hypothetical protein [Acinetobacter baumannii]